MQPLIVKALSLHEPWGSMIADGTKSIETRMWSTRYRGPLAICATKMPKYPRSGQLVAFGLLLGCRLMKAEDEPQACCGCDPGRFAWLLDYVIDIGPEFFVCGQQGLFDLEIHPSLVPRVENVLEQWELWKEAENERMAARTS